MSKNKILNLSLNEGCNIVKNILDKEIQKITNPVDNNVSKLSNNLKEGFVLESSCSSPHGKMIDKNLNDEVVIINYIFDFDVCKPNFKKKK